MNFHQRGLFRGCLSWLLSYLSTSPLTLLMQGRSHEGGAGLITPAAATSLLSQYNSDGGFFCLGSPLAFIQKKPPHQQLPDVPDHLCFSSCLLFLSIDLASSPPCSSSDPSGSRASLIIYCT
jgi:hypothetical protein